MSGLGSLFPTTFVLPRLGLWRCSKSPAFYRGLFPLAYAFKDLPDTLDTEFDRIRCVQSIGDRIEGPGFPCFWKLLTF